MATIMLAKLNANAHESIHILMEDIGDFVAFQTTCHLCFVFDFFFLQYTVWSTT